MSKQSKKASEQPCKGKAYRVRPEAPENWRDRATITVEEYAAVVGIGRNTAYEAARRGDVHTIRLRGRILVTVPSLRRQLGE